MADEVSSNLQNEDLNTSEVEENQANRQRDLFSPSNQTKSSAKKIFGGRLLFQRLLVVSSVQLVIYLNKLYNDCNAVREYYSAAETNYFIISTAALIMPPLIYSVFLIGENLIHDDNLDKKAVTTKAINGLLLFPWQLKRHLDLLHYVAAKMCIFRAADGSEKEDLSKINRRAEILEFFEDFYAGFLQLLLHLYILWNHYLKSTSDTKGYFLYYQLLASALSVLSLMIGVRRRDDGWKLTAPLSLIGWLSLFVSRIVLFVLIAEYYGAVFLTSLCLLHAIAMSAWIYGIAIESYRVNKDSNHTHRWTARKKTSLALTVFVLFGIPSLLMWAIMFQLKEHWRPLKFLIVITLENLLLIALWLAPQYIYEKHKSLDTENVSVPIAIGVAFATLLALVFLSLYSCCKPQYTDLVVLHEINECSAQLYGINFEFCKLVFKMPSTKSVGRKLQRVRNAHLFERI